MAKKKYCYEYPRPSVATDCVILFYEKRELKVLLIRRGAEPFKEKWAIPGGFLDTGENAEEGILREIKEETGIGKISIRQLHTFTKVDRDPRGRTISISYTGLVRPGDNKTKAGDDASDAVWFNVFRVPPLAFDHDKILELALDRLRRMTRFEPVVFELLPEKFTIPRLQGLYETIMQIETDRRNFSKKVLNTGLLKDLNVAEKGVPHRGAGLYSFDMEKYEKMVSEGFTFPEFH